MVVRLAAPGLLIILLLSSCAMTPDSNDTANLTNTTSQNLTDTTNITDANLTNASGATQVSAFANATWARLTENNVERFCEAEAEQEAGDDAWAIKGCICDQMASNGMKQFECDVFSIEPSRTKHHIRLTCFLEHETCAMESNIEDKVFSFPEISPLLG